MKSTLKEKNDIIDEIAILSKFTSSKDINIYKHSVLTNSHIGNNSVIGDFSKA